MENTSTTPTTAPTVEREADSADKVFQDIVAACDLPAGQKKAIVLLMFGNTPGRAAQAAGVHRGTLYRWMKNDPAFGRVLSECRAARFADAGEQLTSLIGECVNIVYSSIVAGDKQLAFRLLRAFGVFKRRGDGDWTGLAPPEFLNGEAKPKAGDGPGNPDLSREAKLALVVGET